MITVPWQCKEVRTIQSWDRTKGNRVVYGAAAKFRQDHLRAQQSIHLRSKSPRTDWYKSGWPQLTNMEGTHSCTLSVPIRCRQHWYAGERQSIPGQWFLMSSCCRFVAESALLSHNPLGAFSERMLDVKIVAVWWCRTLRTIRIGISSELWVALPSRRSPKPS